MGRQISDIIRLCVIAEDTARRARRLTTIITTEWFKHVYDKSERKEREAIENMIQQADVTRLMKLRSRSILEYFTYTELREIAQTLKIYSYSRLTRSELITAITKHGKQSKSKIPGNGVSVQASQETL